MNKYQKSSIKDQNLGKKVKIFGFLFFSLIFAFCFLNFEKAQAALLYSGSANEVIYENHTFVVEWYLDTQDQLINSVDLKLHFTPESLEVLSADAGSSSLNLWVKTPTFNNRSGTIELIGGVAGGLDTSKMNLFRTTFKAKKTGPAQIIANESSKVFLNDGLGSDLKLSFMRLSFPIVEGTTTGAAVSSDTHPDETVWYKNNNLEFEVFPKIGEIYSYSFSINPEMIPDDKQDEVSHKFKYDNLPDGIYYFKLATKNNQNQSTAWTESLVHRFQIDVTPPEEFTPNIGSDPSLFEGQQFVSFASTDKTSGIDHYEIRFGGIGFWTSVNQTYYVLPKLTLADKVQIKAVDKAGNIRFAETAINQSNQAFDFSKLLIWIIIIISLLLVTWLIRHILVKTRIRNK